MGVCEYIIKCDDDSMGKRVEQGTLTDCIKKHSSLSVSDVESDPGKHCTEFIVVIIINTKQLRGY